MRKILAILIVVLVVTGSLQAQIIEGYGVKAGISITNLDHRFKEWDFDLEWDNRIGIVIGGFVEWFDIPFFSVVTELRYFQKGMTSRVEDKDEYNQDIGTITYNYRLDYLSLSALAKYNLSLSVIKPFICAGPRLDILLGNGGDDGMEILFDEFEPLELGADLGLGSEISIIGLPTFLAEFRYNFYFSKAYENELVESTNRSMEVLIGIKF